MTDTKGKLDNYKINPDTENWAIVTLTNEIDKGYKLQSKKGKKNKISSEDIINFSRAIIVSPDYQREYRFTLEDESKLIESIF